MPTYEYVCTECDHNFEEVQSFKDDSLTTCPSCGQETLRKKFSAAGIIFKGSGWHIKDYASGSSGGSSGGAPKPSDSSSNDSSKSESSSSSSGDSSPSGSDAKSSSPASSSKDDA